MVFPNHCICHIVVWFRVKFPLNVIQLFNTGDKKGMEFNWDLTFFSFKVWSCYCHVHLYNLSCLLFPNNAVVHISSIINMFYKNVQWTKNTLEKMYNKNIMNLVSYIQGPFQGQCPCIGVRWQVVRIYYKQSSSSLIDDCVCNCRISMNVFVLCVCEQIKYVYVCMSVSVWVCVSECVECA
jgi:hypothetical protein